LQVYTGHLRKNLEVNTSAVYLAYLVKTFPGMLQIYTGYLPMVRDCSMDFVVGN